MNLRLAANRAKSWMLDFGSSVLNTIVVGRLRHGVLASETIQPKKMGRKAFAGKQ